MWVKQITFNSFSFHFGKGKKKLYEGEIVIIFLSNIHQFKHVFWVLKRTLSLKHKRDKNSTCPLVITSAI